MSVYVTDQSQFPRRIRFDWIGEAFSIFGKNAGTWIGATLISVGVSVLISFLFGAFKPVIGLIQHPGTYMPAPTPPGQQLLSFVVSLLVNSFLYAGQAKMAVKAVRGEPISITDLFGGANVFVQTLFFNLLFVLSLMISAFLCVLPVFVAYTALWPGFALVADGEGVGSAFSKSWNGVKQDWLNAGLFGFVLLLLVLVSEIPVFLGLFVTVPMTFIIGALIYRDMIGMPGAGPDSPMSNPYAAIHNPSGVWPPPPTQGVPPASNPFPPVNNPFPPTQTPGNPYPPMSNPYPPSSFPPIVPPEIDLPREGE